MRGRELFEKLNSAGAVRGLIGKSEDAHLDCKEWPASDEDAQRVFAKAACGLTNAEGGVLVIDMRARPSREKDEPDRVESAVPVPNTEAVRSRVLDLIGQLVEPGIEGVQVSTVSEREHSDSGFVVVYVPGNDGPPKRSRKDWKFYIRIGSGTLPMEYFQIADMFGKRPQPELELYIEETGEFDTPPFMSVPHRHFWFGLKNVGRGLAKFPSIRFKRDCGLRVSQFGLDGNCRHGLREHPDNQWVMFRGGVDDVIYPGETLKITELLQPSLGGQIAEHGTIAFDEITCTAVLSCDGMQMLTVEKLIPYRTL